MNLVDYLESIEGLRGIDRTVSAQEVSPDDNGTLRYPIFFPLEDVQSTRLGDISVGNYRPTASRREWNGPGRLIPVQTPDTRDVGIIPIEGYFTIGEEDIQRLEEYTQGDERAMLRRVGLDVESRTDGLTEAVYRRVETDAFRLWATGKVVQDDPQTGDELETDFKFGSDRVQVAGTPWSVSNAYEKLLEWLKDGVPAVGGRIEGVMLSSSMFTRIKEAGPTIDGKALKRSELEDEIADELGNQFRFVTNDDTVDLPVDGGLDFQNALVWPVTRVAAIPGGGRVGITARAPVARAAQLNREFPEARIDRNGIAVYYISLNEGKGAKIAAQGNLMSIPNKSRVWTIDAGAI